MPAVAVLDELANRKRIDEFIRNRDRRPIGNLLDGVMPRDWHVGALKHLLLKRAQRWADLDQMNRNGGVKVRQRFRGTQRIGHQCASARSKLDELQVAGRTHLFPYSRG